MEQPVLLPKLKSALACLFNTNHENQQYAAEAHKFLLTFKSSNLRRLVVSRIQSQKDKSSDNNIISLEDDLHRHAEDSASHTFGSIYLSCLAALLTSSSRASSYGSCNHERIFAAQTLNHRCRSIKLVESYDIEAEDGLEGGVARLVLSWEEKRQRGVNVGDEESMTVLNAWLERYVPMLVQRCHGMDDNNNTGLCHGGQLLAIVLKRHSSSLAIGSTDGERGEERIKGKLILITLAVALYSMAFSEQEEEHYLSQHHNPQHRTPWANAVLSELGSALSVTALRIRYRPSPSKHEMPDSEPGVPSLIDLLLHSIHIVADAATEYFLNQQQQYGHDDSRRNLIDICHQHAIKRSVAACLTSLPETVLLPPGSDKGDDSHRIPSIDRACLRAASMELRYEKAEHGTGGTGMERMLMEMIRSELGESDIESTIERLDNISALRLFECCESWARFVSVPLGVVAATVGRLAIRFFVNQHESIHCEKTQNAAFQYVTSIFEGASPSLTVEDILSATLGVAAGGVSGKKKQGNKSKKRQERRLKNAAICVDSNDTGNNQGYSAEDELAQRKNGACLTAALIFGASVHDILGKETMLRLSTPSLYTHTICSTISVAAASVLPRLLWLERNANKNNNSSEEWWLSCFEVILCSLKRLCQSTNRDIRALSYEPLMTLHESLNSTPFVKLAMEQLAVDAVCECALALSNSCSYPVGYFRDLSINSDGDIEVERNDVRDVVRSVSNFDAGNFGADNTKSPSLLILEHFIDSIHAIIQEASHHTTLPQESAVHALSALAKPLNKIGKKYIEQLSINECIVILRTLQSYTGLFQLLNSSLQSLPTSQILPVSRLALMGLASLSPMFSYLVEIPVQQVTTDLQRQLFHGLENSLKLGIQHALMASAKIPELAAESTLQSTRYDIRGTMRGPGGEDHVGCIALMRLSFESNNLAHALTGIYGPTLLSDVANLHNELKILEQKRSPGCDFGIGVCPISRRLVLRSLSRICMLQMETDQGSKTMLQELLQVTLAEIDMQKDLPLTCDKLSQLCESVYDLASLDPFVVANLFSSPTQQLELVIDSLLAGYSRISFASEIDPWMKQWARLRGAVMCLLKTSCQDRMTNPFGDALSALLNAEICAALLQCNQGPLSGSNIFIDHVIGEEMLNAGAYLIVVRESLCRIASTFDPSLENQMIGFQQCLMILSNSVSSITQLLLSQSPEATLHTDPRPTIAEAWFQTIASLISVCNTDKFKHCDTSDSIEEIIGASLFICVALILTKDLGNKVSPPPEIQRGMSLDGPQTLAMMEFMSDAILLGPGILVSTSRIFASQFKFEQYAQDANLGGSIVAAGLLRAASGALPPWAVELTPIIFRSLFEAFGGDCDNFIRSLELSTKLESSGEVFAGRYFENVSSVHISSFLSKTREACTKGEWNKMKSIVKTACGGKKKESGFNLKPQFTCWECERL